MDKFVCLSVPNFLLVCVVFIDECGHRVSSVIDNC